MIFGSVSTRCMKRPSTKLHWRSHISIAPGNFRQRFVDFWTNVMPWARWPQMTDHKPVSFVVPGEAIGKGRPRVSTVGGHARMFTPKKTANYETLISMAAQQAMAGRELIPGPVMVEMKIVVAVAASWSKKKTAAALEGTVMPTKKPDADNVLKAICDGINGIVFKDDVQVVNVSLSKRFGETPGVSVRVVPLMGESS